jgi:hypothetical protein
MDLVWIQLMRKKLNEMAEEEGNPLREWLDLSRAGARAKKRPATGGEMR